MPNSQRFLLSFAAAALLSMTVRSAHAAGRPDPAQMGENPNSLYLSAGTIDLETLPSLLDAADAAFAPQTAYVLHLDGPITPNRRQLLEATGVHFGAYLPMNSYIVNLAEVQPDSLRELEFVTWIGEFRKAWKLSPDIQVAKAFETDERKNLDAAGAKRFDVTLFQGADMADALRAIDTLGSVVQDVQPRVTDCTLEIDLAENKLGELADVPSIQFIAEAPEGTPRNSSSAWITQSNILNFKPLYNAGIHGENQIVALIDWDLDENHCTFSDSIPPGPTHRKIIEYFNNNVVPGGFGYHGTFTGSILAGDELAGTVPDFKGMAYAAKMVVQNYLSNITSSNLYDRLEYSHNFGARLHSNSWGSNSDNSYNLWAHDIDQFTRDYEDDVVVVAILNGSVNSPAGSILSPENAKNCIATAACGDTPNQENHGSGARGPTIDNRQKPELWFPGCPDSANVNTACGVVNRGCATSWSAPHATGLTALVRQYFMEGRYPTGISTPANAFTPSGALIKATMINAAVDMSGFAGYFGTHEGYGRVLLDQALYFPGDARKTLVWDVRNSEGLSTEQTDTYEINIDSNAEKLKIALVWTDPAATVGTSFAPVNNLNLIVTDPSNNTFFGNKFSGAESVTGGAPDPRNNTEVVLKSNPTPGTWTLQIFGSSVAVGAQGYALVVSGDVSAPVSCLKGDMNDDGILDAADIDGFINVMFNGGSPRENCAADINDSGTVDPSDVGPFAALLVGVAYCPRLKGDLNGDRVVDGRDIQGFADVLIGGGDSDELCAADLNQSGESNDADKAPFVSLLTQFF